MQPHAFVAMPFGTKLGADGQTIDFNRVYAEYIRPALEAAGLEVFRADEEQRAGDIRSDMFQELLVADLVVADLTLDNPNVWYELGVRHALRARGVVLVQGPRANQPFDIYTDRKLLLAERNEFSDAYESWASRMEIARQKNRPGDILVLADETPIRALHLEAKRAAGNALLKLRQYELALEQFATALAIDPADKASREKEQSASAVSGVLKKRASACVDSARTIPPTPNAGRSPAASRRNDGSRSGGDRG